MPTIERVLLEDLIPIIPKITARIAKIKFTQQQGRKLQIPSISEANEKPFLSSVFSSTGAVY